MKNLDSTFPLCSQVSFLENEKMSMTDELDLCQEEEELLIQQLAGLNDKFSSLETTVESLLDHKNTEQTEHAVQQVRFTLEMSICILKLKEEVHIRYKWS